MIEITTNPATRRASQQAHVERAKAIRSAFGWLFGSR